MRVKVNLPKPGMGTDEGTVLRWMKSAGDPVRQDEPLVEIEFAKATQEVLSPANGRLAEILVREGETAAVNTALAEIEAQDD